MPGPEDREKEIWVLKRQRRKLRSDYRAKIKAVSTRIRSLTEPNPTNIEGCLRFARRRRDRDWLTTLMRMLSGGVSMEEAMIAATQATYPTKAAKRDVALKKAREKLRQPDICQAYEALYAIEGFDITEGIRQHIKHIRGFDYEAYDAEGNLHKKTVAPSYQATKDYIDRVTPAKTQKIAVVTASVDMNDMLEQMAEEHVIAPRIVGNHVENVTIDADPNADPFDDELPDDDELDEDSDDADDEDDEDNG